MKSTKSALRSWWNKAPHKVKQTPAQAVQEELEHSRETIKALQAEVSELRSLMKQYDAYVDLLKKCDANYIEEITKLRQQRNGLRGSLIWVLENFPPQTSFEEGLPALKLAKERAYAS